MANCSSSSVPVPKIERRFIEKNRRNHMKALYSQLYSLLPNHPSKEAVAVPLPDQIDEAAKYIKSLQIKVEKMKEKKEALLNRERSQGCTTSTDPLVMAGSISPQPQIEIREIGDALDVILICGEDDKFLFRDIIRVIQEEGAEVFGANFSVRGNSIFHAVHAKAGEFVPDIVTARVSSRLKQLVNRSMEDVESKAEPWEFDIQPVIWEFDIPQVFPMGPC